MKTSLPLVLRLTGAALLLAAGGCHSISMQTDTYVGGPTFPPTKAAEVQVLRAAPTRPHVRLGEITAEPSSLKTPVSEIETKLQKCSAKLGANAVVIVADRTQTTGAVVSGGWYDRPLTPVIGRVVRGVAIRYTP